MRDPGTGLEFLLNTSATTDECGSVAAWWPRQIVRCARHARPIEGAIAGGFAADRLAWAFCAGYQAALRALVPQLPSDTLASLCVTEAAGNHPRAIQTTLRPHPELPGKFILDGRKRWTTLGPDSALLLVAARLDGAADSARIPLKLAQVRQGAPGVSLRAMSEIRFIPEVAHAEVRFENVLVAEQDLLDGDGYARYIKPFRTIEDLHVHAAVMAYLLREALRLAWPRAWVERALAAVHALAAIAQLDASSPATHIALAGALEIGAALTGEADTCWEGAVDDPASLRWKRDRALLSVASSARAQRLERAWENLYPNTQREQADS
jgi:alkylation response protein AidB-like acyl-CoA dehydrogenase